MSDNITLPREVVEFLLGEGKLDGAWFGDKHPDGRSQFWWRKHLFTALAATEPATRWHITDAYCEKTPGNLLSRWDYFYTAWREAERFHGITKEDGE